MKNAPAKKPTAAAAKSARMERNVKIVKGIAYTIFALGLGLSIFHIFDYFYSTLHAALASALAMPVFIDGVQIFGRIIRGADFSRRTRTAGWIVQGIGAAASLAANLIAGTTIGDKISGAAFVAGYILLEAIAELIRPASDDTAAERKAQAADQRAARKARLDAERAERERKAQTRRESEARRREERQATEERQRLAEIDALNAKYLADASPISAIPAPVDFNEIGTPTAYL